jgi:hypothetical protein
MHVPDALWFTYLPVFRSVARLSRRTCNTLRILLTIPIGPPFQVPQHGDPGEPQPLETMALRMTARPWGNGRVPGLKRAGHVGCLYWPLLRTLTSTDWRFGSHVGSGPANLNHPVFHLEGGLLAQRRRKNQGRSARTTGVDMTLSFWKNYGNVSIRTQLWSRSSRTGACLIQQYITVPHIYTSSSWDKNEEV